MTITMTICNNKLQYVTDKSTFWIVPCMQVYVDSICFNGIIQKVGNTSSTVLRVESIMYRRLRLFMYICYVAKSFTLNIYFLKHLIRIWYYPTAAASIKPLL